MVRAFDPFDLAALHAAQEICIHTSSSTVKPVIIWVVVVGHDVFVRSVRGPKGRWHVAAVADGKAELEVRGRRLPMKVTPVSDDATNAAVSQAFLAKYADSPYAKVMVAGDPLTTTLRLSP